MNTDYSPSSERESTPRATGGRAIDSGTPSDVDGLDGHALFERVEAALGRREFGTPPEGRHLAQWMRDALREALGPVAVDLRSGHRDCDLVVADAVGIEIVDGLGPYGEAGLRRHLETVARDYEYVLVFVHALPGDARDEWWLTKRRCTARRLGVRELAFVKPDRGDDGPDERSPTRAWLLLGPAVAALALYLAVGLVEASRISSHPMLQLIVPAIGVTVLLVLVLKTFGDV